MITKSTNNKTHFILFFLVLVLLTLIMTYIYYPLPLGHDFVFHLNRLVALMDAIKNENFPNYIDYNAVNKYGYATKLFYSDVLLIPYAIVGLLTNTVSAIASLVFSNTILCGLFSYYAFKRVTKDSYTAMIGSILYTFSAYRILDIYVRCAVGEIFTFTLLPLVVLGGYEIIYGDYKKWYVLSISFSLLIYSHVISTLIVFIVLVIIILFEYKRFWNDKQRIKYLFIAGVVSLFITAYYIIPMIEQMLSNTFYYELQAKNNTPILGYSIQAFVLGLFSSFMNKWIGTYVTVGLILMLPIALRFFIRERFTPLKYIDIYLLVGILLVMSNLDLFPWQYYPFKLLKFMQFAWRLNLVSTLILSVTGAYLISVFLKKEKVKIIFLIIMFFVQVGIFYSHSRYYYDKSKSKTTNYEKYEYHTATKASAANAEYLPSKVPSPFIAFFEERGQTVKSKNGLTNITHLKKDKGHTTFDAEVGNDDQLELPLNYYIGYAATLDGEALPYQQSENGLIELSVNKSGKVEMIYTGTSLQKVSYYLTIISIVLFTIFIIVNRRKNKQLKQQ